MTGLVIAPAVPVHRERYGVERLPTRNRLLVLHTTEGGEGTDSAEQLAGFLAQPASRSATGAITNQASYHWIIDTARAIPAVPENVVAYSAPGANNDGIHIVFPGRANQTRAQWLDETSSAYLDVCAELVVDRTRGTGIPLVRLTVPEVVAGRSGLCDHYTLTLAYRRTTHTDVGTGFPWDVLGDRIAALTSPTPTASPAPLGGTNVLGLFIINNDPNGVVLVGMATENGVALVVEHCSPSRFEALIGSPDHRVFAHLARQAFKTTTLLGTLPPGWDRRDFAQVITGVGGW